MQRVATLPGRTGGTGRSFRALADDDCDACVFCSYWFSLPAALLTTS